MNENDKILGKTKEKMEEDNIFELTKAMQLKIQCLENFMRVSASFVKFPEERFKKILINAADVLINAHENVMHHVKLIGHAYKADVNCARVELADGTELEAYEKQ